MIKDTSIVIYIRGGAKVAMPKTPQIADFRVTITFTQLELSISTFGPNQD